MIRRHGRQEFFIPGEGVIGPEHNADNPRAPGAIEETRRFRFSRMYPEKHEIKQFTEGLRDELAKAMVAAPGPESDIPAGFTYLGQFVDHDLTLDKTAAALGSEVTVEQLLQGRSPALDLDCLYGLGSEQQPQFYSDGVRLKTGSTIGTNFPPDKPEVRVDREGYDLPRVGVGPDATARRLAQIPDARNDENLAVAQVHAAFIRFHNRVVEKLAGEGRSVDLFRAARSLVVKHYQWMLREDYLPKIIDQDVLADVFKNGRRFFEAGPRDIKPDAEHYHPTQRGGDYPSMPIEFSVAAFRMGHSMVRESYEWNSVFQSAGPGPAGSLALLFNFSGTSGTLSPPGSKFERLPTNWIADWLRLFDFGDHSLANKSVNRARTINTLLVDPLQKLPPGSFGGFGGGLPPEQQQNLAFRNLERARMVKLPSGQQMAKFLGAVPLADDALLRGKGVNGGADLSNSSDAVKKELLENAPLWFYILREAETGGQFKDNSKRVGGDGKLGPVGSLIVAEVFHRAMETSVDSIVREPEWRPTLGKEGRFTMTDLLFFAFEQNSKLLAPLG